jgi:hypothetical protein
MISCTLHTKARAETSPENLYLAMVVYSADKERDLIERFHKG